MSETNQILEMNRYWSKAVHGLTPYTPGEQPALDNLVKLNTNENPYEPSPKVIKAIQEAAAETLRKYPDPTAHHLKQTIADYHALSVDQIFVANSSDEVLAHAFRALLKQQKPLLFPDITYSFYPVWCALFDISYQTVALRDDFSINVDDFSIRNGGIIVANPNAPTGIALDLQQIEKLLQNNSDSVVVVDEAYVDFADASAISLIGQYDNLLVVQTASKSRSLAGLRVGFAFGNAQLIEALERVKNSFHPYALDALALAGATASFADDEYFKQVCTKVINTREHTIKRLRDLDFTVVPSKANFVLAKHADCPSSRLFQALRERGVVVRYFDAPRIDQYVRISIGTDAEMDRLIDAISDII